MLHGFSRTIGVIFLSCKSKPVKSFYTCISNPSKIQEVRRIFVSGSDNHFRNVRVMLPFCTKLFFTVHSNYEYVIFSAISIAVENLKRRFFMDFVCLQENILKKAINRPQQYNCRMNLHWLIT